MFGINPIELLLRLRNEMGPQLVEADAQLAGLAAKTTAVGVASDVAAVQTTALSTAMVSLNASLLAVGGAGLAFGLALKASAERMMEMGEAAYHAERAGQAISLSEQHAKRFYETVSEAKERLSQLGTNIAVGFLPTLTQLAVGLNSVTIAAEKLSRLRLPDWLIHHERASEKNLLGYFNGKLMYGQEEREPAGRTGWFHGTWDWEAERRPPKTPGSPKPKMWQPDYEDFIAAAGDYQRPSPTLRKVGPDDSQALETMMRVKDWLAKVKEPANALTSSMEQMRANLQSARFAANTVANAMGNFAASAVLDFQHVGESFKNMIQDILADIARQQVAKGIGSLLNIALNAATGGASGGVTEILKTASKGNSGNVTINVNAMSAKDLIRSLTSPAGEMNQMQRQMALSARLP